MNADSQPNARPTEREFAFPRAPLVVHLHTEVWETLVSQCGPWTSSTSITWEFVRMQHLGLTQTH